MSRLIDESANECKILKSGSENEQEENEAENRDENRS